MSTGKKLVNSPEDAVDEALAGMVAVHPGLRLLEGHRVVVRADIASVVKEGKVTLLSGGGSGHEPSWAGFVGQGMLSAAVAGSVFASPPPASILAALRAISSPNGGGGRRPGTLVVFNNYTGDRLNFGIAAERAKAEGMKVEMVIVAEDTALPSSGKKAGRRGLCGSLLVMKIAGALSEQGATLEEVVEVAQRAADSVATMSVSLSPCSVPGHKPSFHLQEDEMELGLGIHGEAGAERAKLQPANKVVARMLDHLTSQEPGYQYFKPEPGMEVALVVNNLGGTSNLELSLVANAAIRYLVDRMGLKVERAYVGAFMTSLEMAGVSLTLLKLFPKCQQLLDYLTNAPGWPNTAKDFLVRCDTSKVPSSERESGDGLVQETKTDPKSAIGVALRGCVERVCGVLCDAEGELNALDRGGGDGDCGSTLKAGAQGIKQAVPFIDWDTPHKALLAIAGCVERDMGGTSGALYTLFLTAGSKCLLASDPSNPLCWAKALQEGMEAIMKYGKASVGDRTMLDALSPATDELLKGLAVSSSSKAEAIAVLKRAVEAAELGAKRTISMQASAGRASNVNASQLTQRDPGAHAVCLWFRAVLDSLIEN